MKLGVGLVLFYKDKGKKGKDFVIHVLDVLVAFVLLSFTLLSSCLASPPPSCIC